MKTETYSRSPPRSRSLPRVFSCFLAEVRFSLGAPRQGLPTQQCWKGHCDLLRGPFSVLANSLFAAHPLIFDVLGVASIERHLLHLKTRQ